MICREYLNVVVRLDFRNMYGDAFHLRAPSMMASHAFWLQTDSDGLTTWILHTFAFGPHNNIKAAVGAAVFGRSSRLVRARSLFLVSVGAVFAARLAA